MQADKWLVNKCPPIPKDLMDFLQHTYPEKCPDLLEADGIWLYTGRRQLVRWLQRAYDQQQQVVYVRDPALN